MKPISLFICSTPRSGSYLLSDLLEQIGFPFAEELFIPFHQNKLMEDLNLPQNTDYYDFLKAFSSNYRQNGLFAVKVMLGEMKKLLTSLHYFESPELATRIISELFPNPKFVFLKREDSIAQAVSLIRARQTGKWINSVENPQQKTATPHYSFHEIESAHDQINYANSKWCEWLKALNLPFIELTYESINKSPTDQINKIHHFLELAQELFSVPQVSKDRKFRPMRNNLNQEWKNSYILDFKNNNHQVELKLDGTTIELEETNLERSYSIGHRPIIKFSFNCSSQLYKRLSPTHKLCLNFLIKHKSKDYRNIFYCDLIKDSTSTNQLIATGLLQLPILPGPTYSGEYELTIAPSTKRLSQDQIDSNKWQTFTINVEYSLEQIRCRNLFKNVTELPDGWVNVDWFGNFLDNKFPWVYHAQHNWLFFSENCPNSIYQYYDKALGWLETSPTTYPLLRNLETGINYTFKGMCDHKRVFILDNENNEELKVLPNSSLINQGIKESSS